MDHDTIPDDGEKELCVHERLALRGQLLDATLVLAFVVDGYATSITYTLDIEGDYANDWLEHILGHSAVSDAVRLLAP